jgi:hypothetical protein
VVAGIHPLIGLPAIFGLKQLAGSENDDASTEGPTLTQLARAVQVCRFACAGQEQRDTATRLRERVLADWSAQDDTAEGRVVANALAILSGLAGTVPTEITVPNTAGMRLSDATKTLRALNVLAVVEDDLKPGGTPRTPWQEDNWLVVQQELQNSNTTARLLVRKKSDPAR